MSKTTINNLTDLGLEISYSIRNSVNKLSYSDRNKKKLSILKGENTLLPDAVGEEIGINGLKEFSELTGQSFGLIIDANKGDVYEIGSFSRNPIVWTYFDPVDGTIKIAGLGNEKNALFRMGNDGVWATGISFTKPTRKSFDKLSIDDFCISTIIDGNPSMFYHAPRSAHTVQEEDKFITYEILEKDRVFADETINKGSELRLYTTSQEKMSQGIICLDNFQAFDRTSARPEHESLANEVYKILSNRNKKGAFDLFRIYGTFGDILRGTIGYGRDKLEPQGVGSIRLNDHPTNAIPPYAIFKGAGGFVVDFEGKDIGRNNIQSDRPDVIYAANKSIKNQLVNLMKEAKLNIRN